MASSINSTSTGSGGLISTGDDSGILNIQTNETTAITVDASQNVGIGTTSPASDTANERILQVNAPTTFATVSLSTSRANASGDNIGKLSFDVLNNTATYRSRAQIVAQSTGSTANKYGANMLFYTASDNTADATERMRIDSSGNLLVGTTSTPSSATGSVVANNASYIGSNKVVNWTKTNSSNNVTTATVVFQTTSSWFTNYIKFTVSCVQANSANNFAALYLYQVATLDASGGTTRQVLAQGDNAQFTVTVTGNSGTGTQTWTVSVTGPATANRMILTLEAGSALGINATA